MTMKMKGTEEMTKTDKMHTVADVAEILNVSERHVRREISVKKLSAHRFGRAVRISEDDLRSYITRAR